MMWLIILGGGLVIYKLLRRFFSDDVVSEVEASDTEVLLSVANRLEKLFSGKAYTGLRIPDPDSGSRQNIDLVLLTKWEAMVISVSNYAGVVSVAGDGSWVCFDPGDRIELYFSSLTTAAQSPLATLEICICVATTHKKALVLEAYLEQRGFVLPKGFLCWKVILPNPKFFTLIASILSSLPSEIITYGQWEQLKPEQKKMLPHWMKGAFCGVKKEMQETVNQELGFILSTASMWDRLELKGNKFSWESSQSLKGSKMMFGTARDQKVKSQPLTCSEDKHVWFREIAAPRGLLVLYTPRDYRSEGASSSEWKEVTVRSSMEILFLPENASKVCKFKLSAVTSMTLSA